MLHALATQQDRPKTVNDVIQDFDVLYGHNAFSVSPCQPFSINCCYVSPLEINMAEGSLALSVDDKFSCDQCSIFPATHI